MVFSISKYDLMFDSLDYNCVVIHFSNQKRTKQQFSDILQLLQEI